MAAIRIGVLWGALVVALASTTLWAGEAPRPQPVSSASGNSRARPVSKTSAAPRSKSAPEVSAEPTEAQLPPVDPVWRQNGWRPVVPHAFVLRKLLPVRVRPEPGATPAFWLRGGTRVPVIEQGPQWWRIGWTQGRSGWVRAADLEPHASLVFLDARTGRVLRRMATKGQEGVSPEGGFLWTLADTGLTRMSLDEPPAFWSNRKVSNSEAALTHASAWSPDRSVLYVLTSDQEELAEVNARTGALRRCAHQLGASPEGADAQGWVLLNGGRFVCLYDTRRAQEIASRPGEVKAVTRTGVAYVYASGGDSDPVPTPRLSATSAAAGPLLKSEPLQPAAPASVRIRESSPPGAAVLPRMAQAGIRRPSTNARREKVLIRYDADLNPGPRFKVAKQLMDVCLSPDERFLLVSYLTDSGEPIWQIVRADTLAPLARLAPNRDLESVYALVGNTGGWWVLEWDDAPEGDVHLTHYDRRGRQVRSWRAGSRWAMSPKGSNIYIARDSDILVVNTADGRARTIPFSWRRPLPSRYLPQPEDPDSPTHLEVSALTLAEDGRTLILTEWLDGDAAG